MHIRDSGFSREVERVFNLAEAEGLTGMGITHYIEEYIDLANVLRTSSREWDGGYAVSYTHLMPVPHLPVHDYAASPSTGRVY